MRLCGTSTGRQLDQALAEVKKGLEVDPLSLPINHMVGHLLLLARPPDEAIAQFRKTLEIDPRYTLAHNNMGYAFSSTTDSHTDYGDSAEQ